MLFSMRMIFQTLWKKVVFWLGGWWGLSGLDMRLQISQFSSCTHTTLCLLLGAVVGIAELQFDIGSCVAAQAAWLRSFFKVWKKGEKRNLEEKRGKEREERERERKGWPWVFERSMDSTSHFLWFIWKPQHFESPNTLRAPALWEPQHFESPLHWETPAGHYERPQSLWETKCMHVENIHSLASFFRHQISFWKGHPPLCYFQCSTQLWETNPMHFEWPPPCFWETIEFWRAPFFGRHFAHCIVKMLLWGL